MSFRDEMTAEEVRKLNVEYTQDSHHILKKGHLNTLLSSNPACWSLSQSLQLLLVPCSDSLMSLLGHRLTGRLCTLQLIGKGFAKPSFNVIYKQPPTNCLLFFEAAQHMFTLEGGCCSRESNFSNSPSGLHPLAPAFLPLSMIPSPTPAIFILVKISAVN